eukprot:9592945-Alexandrium_andersonii.AAC.1
MSASLVGSEMCIRDSCCHVLQGQDLQGSCFDCPGKLPHDLCQHQQRLQLELGPGQGVPAAVRQEASARGVLGAVAVLEGLQWVLSMGHNSANTSRHELNRAVCISTFGKLEGVHGQHSPSMPSTRVTTCKQTNR